MNITIPSAAHELLPLLRSFAQGPYGIALGGAHAKGLADHESDLDLYLFASTVLPAEERANLTRAFAPTHIEIVSYGGQPGFQWAGTDFMARALKVECRLSTSHLITTTIQECRRGILKREFTCWTPTGYCNHCCLADVQSMITLEDPSGIIGEWKALVRVYPEELRRTILQQHSASVRFWPGNFHYRSAIARVDLLYTCAIVQQVVYDIIQILFALNRVYFPGDKKLAPALGHLPVQPPELNARLQALIAPGAPLDRQRLDEQHECLRNLAADVLALIAKHEK